MLVSLCWGLCVFVSFFFFKQKTAYEMRISDWRSDVCSSDLVAIAFIGLRPGEKLYEELLHDGERLMPAASPGLFLAAPRTIDLGPLQAALNEIEAKARGRRREETLEFLCRLVPEYRVETAQAAIASG